MTILGCDLHTRYQQVAMLNTESGEIVERRLEHENGEARGFYAALPGPVRVGIEATGYTQWFERMLAELGHELWMGDAARGHSDLWQNPKVWADQIEPNLKLGPCLNSDTSSTSSQKQH